MSFRFSGVYIQGMGAGRQAVMAVIGAASGLGIEISTALAREGGILVMLVRNVGRGHAAAEVVRAASGNRNVEVVPCDLASQSSVRAAAGLLQARHPQLQLLVNNAAVFSAERQTTADGLELMLAANHLGPFLLTRLLTNAFRDGAPSRIVYVTLHPDAGISVEDLQAERAFTPWVQFGRSKAAGSCVALELAHRLEGSGVTVNAVYPGLVNSRPPRGTTPAIRTLLTLFGQTQHECARGPVWVATAPELSGTTGRLFVQAREASFPPMVLDDATRLRIWRQSAEWVGLPIA